MTNNGTTGTAEEKHPSLIPMIQLVDDDGLEDEDQDKAQQQRQVIESIRDACRNVGFFYLQGHGMDPAFLDQVMEQSKHLFDLPLAEKKSLSDKAMTRGYTALEEETLDPAVQTTRGDTKEGFYIADDIPKEDPRYNPAKLRGPNVWPSPSTKPQHATLVDFQSIMERYLQEIGAVAMRVVRLIALALELPRDFFEVHFQDPSRFIRLLRYAKVKSEPDHGIFACGAHSDYGMLTLLLTDEHAGLQILDQSGTTWIDAPPKPYTFVVNLGDMLERWTNGLFQSTKHRVLTCGDAERYSIPFFFEPDFDAVVECLPVCCSESNPPRFPPTTAGQHLLDKYNQTHADFAPTTAIT
jgi:isopenicillin N synthase-like dioxygenase